MEQIKYIIVAMFMATGMISEAQDKSKKSIWTGLRGCYY